MIPGLLHTDFPVWDCGCLVRSAIELKRALLKNEGKKGIWKMMEG